MHQYLRLSIVSLVLWFTAAPAFGQSSVFTFQGRLSDGGVPVTGDYDLQFSLFDAVASGAQISTNVTVAPAGVTNGLFTVALDFGAAAFDGAPRWIQVGVRTNGSASAYVILNPRTRVTASPYAITAISAATSLGLTGVLPDDQLSANIARLNFAQTFTGTTLFNPSSGAPFAVGSTNKVVSLNADLLDGLDSAGFWRTAGNAGTNPTNQFLGTTDNQPLEIRVNNSRALRIEPGAGNPNLIGGHRSNSVATGIAGATIAGGGSFSFPNTIRAANSTISGGYRNSIQTNAYESTIGGGYMNLIGTNADRGTIGGGLDNAILTGAFISTIGGGAGNRIETNASRSTIAGGDGNKIGMNAYNSSIGGGTANTLLEQLSTIAGGNANLIETAAGASTVGGGFRNFVHTGSFEATIAGGRDNTIGTNSARSTISGGYVNAIHSNAFESTIGGGYMNLIGTNAARGTIGGGLDNAILMEAYSSTIGGGAGNRIGTNASRSTIGGGEGNQIRFGSFNATISGGVNNVIQDGASTASVGGGDGNTIETGSFVSTIAGGAGNTVKPGAPNSFIGGGALNVVGTNAFQSVISGGTRNSVLTINATVGGGVNNSIQAEAWASVISGGEGSMIQPNAKWATIPGGLSNLVTGAYGFAAGRRAKANHTGAFVWADSTDADVTSSNNNQFVVRASGGVTFYSNPGSTAGVNLPPGGGAFSSLSDRNAKTDIQPVACREILEVLSRIPVATWSYKSQDASIRHIGPMAQDFHQAFAVGEDERHISTIDADGVALAAIQGLNELVKEKDAKIQTLEDRIAALEKAVGTLLAPTGKESK
jgi:hypothetical protein